jgi:hypothetical protein
MKIWIEMSAGCLSRLLSNRMRWAIALLVLASTVSSTGGLAAASGGPVDPRFFDATRYRVDRDAFWDFFQKRGGLRTFGYPVSRDFLFFGCSTQLFQRVAMQQCGAEGVGTLTPISTAARCRRRIPR